MPGTGGDLTAEPWLDVSGVHCEGVVWDDAAGRLRFVDIPRGRVFDAGVDTADGADVGWFDLPAPVTAVHPTTEPGDSRRRGRRRRGPGHARRAALERLAAPLAGRPEIRMNDGGVDPAGRYFAGSMAYDVEPGAGGLYRLDTDRSLHTVLTGVTISNGVDWSPDSTLCYFVDSPPSPRRRVRLRRDDGCPVQPARVRGHLRHPRDARRAHGRPEGAVWVAFWGGSRVCRFGPDGLVERTIGLPVSQVTSCCFAGPDLDRLIISTSTEELTPDDLRRQPTAGMIFRAEPGCRGRRTTDS